MLKKILLATTALVLCASLACAGQESVVPKGSNAMAKAFRGLTLGHAGNAISARVITTGRGAPPVHNIAPHLEGAIFSNYSRDANAQFISWYGYSVEYTSSCYSYSNYHSCYGWIKDNALPFTPAASVTTKKVTVPLFSFNPSAQYKVDIYSSVGGLPGSVIAGSKKFTASDTALCCTASRTVTIKANLIAGTQYFIGVVGVCCNADGGWNMEDSDMSGAAVDYYHWTVIHPTWTSYCFSGSACSSPWHASTQLPETGAVMLK